VVREPVIVPITPVGCPAASSGRVEDGLHEECGRRLAIRSRDTDDSERRRRVAVKLGRGQCHCAASVGDNGLRHIEVERPLDQQRDGAARGGRGGELMAVAVCAR
jgi:hypothetical protein